MMQMWLPQLAPSTEGELNVTRALWRSFEQSVP